MTRTTHMVIFYIYLLVQLVSDFKSIVTLKHSQKHVNSLIWSRQHKCGNDSCSDKIKVVFNHVESNNS